MLRRTEYHACDSHVGATNIIVAPLSLASIPGVLGRMGEKHMVTFLHMVDTKHWLLDFPDLASRPCRLGVDETSGMQKGYSWGFLISDKFLQILPEKVSNRSCPENCGTPNLLSHSDDLVGTLQ